MTRPLLSRLPQNQAGREERKVTIGCSVWNGRPSELPAISAVGRRINMRVFSIVVDLSIHFPQIADRIDDGTK